MYWGLKRCGGIVHGSTIIDGFRKEKQETKQGGVALYIKKMYMCSEVQYEVGGRPVECQLSKSQRRAVGGMSPWVSAIGHQAGGRSGTLNN